MASEKTIESKKPLDRRYLFLPLIVIILRWGMRVLHKSGVVAVAVGARGDPPPPPFSISKAVRWGRATDKEEGEEEEEEKQRERETCESTLARCVCGRVRYALARLHTSPQSLDSSLPVHTSPFSRVYSQSDRGRCEKGTDPRHNYIGGDIEDTSTSTLSRKEGESAATGDCGNSSGRL